MPVPPQCIYGGGGLAYAMLAVAAMCAAALGHSLHWPTNGEFAVPPGTEHYDRIVALKPQETITMQPVESFTATPAFKSRNEADVWETLFEASCFGGVVRPDDVPTDIFRAYEQIAVFAPWDLGAKWTECGGVVTIKNKGNTRFLVFLGGSGPKGQGVAELIVHGAHNLWYHAAWNDEAWTFPTFVVAAGFVVAAAFWVSIRHGGAQIMTSKGRFYLYVLAIAGFSAAAIEGITHSIISSNRLGGADVAQAIAIVIGPNVGAIAFTLISMYGRYDWMQSHYWGVAELGVGFAYMLFWIGLYVGPAGIMAAALLRLYEGKDAKLVAFVI